MASVTGVELVVLDPSEVADARQAVDISQWVGSDGPDWGDAEIAAYMAEAERGQLPVDFRVPNRVVRIPLVLLDQADATFDDIRRAVQAKAALFQAEGGWIKRHTPLGPVYADVVSASLKLGGKYNFLAVDADAVLTLECLPDWYGDEEVFDAISETTAPEVARVLTSGGVNAVVRGDYSGRVRIVVTEDQGADQLGAFWAWRSRHYDSSPTARLAYEAEALTALDAATVATVTGASGEASNNAIAHTNLGATWTSVVGTNISGSTYMTHRGTYRVMARVRSVDGQGVSVRFVYGVGDAVLPTENAAWVMPGASAWYPADLGEIRLDRASAGTHRWIGQIQAKGATGGENIEVDRLWLIPVDEGTGRLRAVGTIVDGLTSFSARDEYNQTAGALTGKTLPVGGAWSGAGDPDDFTVNATAHTAERSVGDIVSSAGTIVGGRFALAGTATYTTIAVAVDVKWGLDAPTVKSYSGVTARYVDTNNWLVAVANPLIGATSIGVYMRVAGTVTLLGSVLVNGVWTASHTLMLAVTASGAWSIWAYAAGSVISAPLAKGQDSALATGGALATGQIGIYDVGVTEVD